MQNFIVLGLIPGTDIQITFAMWLIIALGLVVLFLLAILWLRLRFQKWLRISNKLNPSSKAQLA
jgi:hypothetical protein